ncbi:Phosphatidylinositol N-acetylglucosaminyltransferase subunit A [Clonorchis sinensis]|uniref:Phosphatidylinositol N-acetylglucosaminyltransferase subunit A n=1 Tax=Clonorchis sinensis TaxID=79923 RepID=A0A419Q937_CLOSI|nr:Phosphatidylinositol N-acetylglucosaminyltransferase subunit A [Clonorchis sinensis]
MLPSLISTRPINRALKHLSFTMSYDYLNWPKKHENKLSIAMACDFFFPNVGGVETHIYSLAQCLIRRGHRVIVITHSYGPVGKQRQSVRYMGRGLKVYYLPLVPFYRQTIFFTLFGTLPIIREILIREQVDLLHGHSSFSDLGHEAILHAQSLGIRTVFTDHSLFGFADLSSVTMNKVVESVLSAVDHVICVSHTCKENTVLRSKLDPNRVFVIPNAIESSMFIPDPTAKDPNFAQWLEREFTDQMVRGSSPTSASRLPLFRLGHPGSIPSLVIRSGDMAIGHRKGVTAERISLLVISGDGPKRLDLEEVRERHHLHSRVKLLGSLKPSDVRGVIIQGDIFLNTSLTEAFCIALLEAVSCGLLVVSTSVGGVPEVLPDEFVRLAPVRPSDLAQCLAEAIREVLQQRRNVTVPCSRTTSLVTPVNPSVHTPPDSSQNNPPCETPAERAWRMHNWVKNAYSWPQVARRTEKVYYSAVAREKLTFEQLIERLSERGGLTGPTLVVLAWIHWLFLQFLCWWRPEHTISKVPYLAYPVEDTIDISVDKRAVGIHVPTPNMEDQETVLVKPSTIDQPGKLWSTTRGTGVISPKESTKTEILPGCPSLDRSSGDAVVGFEPRTFLV